MARSASPGYPITAATLAGRAHVCALMNGVDEASPWIARLVADAGNSEKTIFLLDADGSTGLARLGRKARLNASGEPRPVEALDWRETYLEGGRFDAGAMTRIIQALILRGYAEGYELVRIVADMSWANQNVEGVETLREYESALNDVLSDTGGEVICLYGLDAFSRAVVRELGGDPVRLGPDFIIDVARAHPSLINHARVCSNDYYLPPEAYLSQLRARREQL